MTLADMRVMGFPARYVQGPGALAVLDRLLSEFAPSGQVAVIADPVVAGAFDALRARTPRVHVLPFGGECTEDEISRLGDQAAAIGARVVVGAGGGKALDTAKGVARVLDSVLVVVPTIASSDAPTSRLIAVYDREHRIVSVPMLKRNPDAVIVDTAIIARAPRRFFVAGIGDAITKRFEVAQAAANGLTNYFGGRPPSLAMCLAEHAYTTIRSEAADALASLQTGKPNDALERVVEATVLHSGLAFEGGGLSVAHGMLRGLTGKATEGFLHGELVAYGLLVQLCATGHPRDETRELMGFMKAIGLPTRLAEIGITDSSPRALEAVAENTFTAPYVAAGAPRLSVAGIVAAMREVEAMASRPL